MVQSSKFYCFLLSGRKEKVVPENHSRRMNTVLLRQRFERVDRLSNYDWVSSSEVTMSLDEPKREEVQSRRQTVLFAKITDKNFITPT